MRRGLGALLVVAGLAGCQASAARHLAEVDAAQADAEATFPVDVVDGVGRSVLVPHEPRRIIALLPSHTETLFALGVGDRVVGVDDFSDEPPAARSLPRLGGLYDTHLEEALSLAPDLVLISETSAALGPLSRARVPTWAGSAAAFDDVFKVIGSIGTLVGRSAEAAALVRTLKDEVSNIEDTARHESPISVYYELDATPYAIGPQSFVGVMLAKVGAINIVPPELGPFPKINPELVVAKNPAVIIGPAWEEVAARPGWGRIEAVREHRVRQLSAREEHLIIRPGPRLAQAMRLLQRIVHPEP